MFQMIELISKVAFPRQIAALCPCHLSQGLTPGSVLSRAELAGEAFSSAAEAHLGETPSIPPGAGWEQQACAPHPTPRQPPAQQGTGESRAVRGCVDE